MRALFARALLPVLLLLSPGAFAQAQEGYDFEGAGGAMAAGPMYTGAMERIRLWCTSQVPGTAERWDTVQSEWDARNAPWLAAVGSVREEAFAALRAQGEDPALIEPLLAPMVQQFLDETMRSVKASGETDGPEATCTRLVGLVDDGLLDIKNNEYAPAVRMLRQHLPETP